MYPLSVREGIIAFTHTKGCISNTYVGITAKGDIIKGFYTFRTQELSLTTLTPKVVNPGEVIVAASTNLFDETTNAGFEWHFILYREIIVLKFYGGKE